ncbi:MAG: HTH domain-containing protein [Limisphaerales bacterium]
MEQKQTVGNNLSWREAIVEVLRIVGKPMSSADIVAAIKKRGLRNVTGNTPEATVGAQIYISIKKGGKCSPFVQISPNVFRFKEPSKIVGYVPQPGGVNIPTDEPTPPSETAKRRMPLTYDDPLIAVFLRTLAWENDVGREPKVNELAEVQVQTARKALGLKPNTKGAPHEFIQSLRKGTKPLLSAGKPPRPLEPGWDDKAKVWRLLCLPDHGFVRLLSHDVVPSNPTHIQPTVQQFSLRLRNPSVPRLDVLLGHDKPKKSSLKNNRGVYFIREPDGLYVGQSEEFEVRWTGHTSGRKIEWWMFIAPQDLDGAFTLDALNVTEALLISFWNEICHVTNDQRGKDKKPAFVHLQQGILLAEAASAALLWFIRERKGKEFGFASWSLPFKECRANHWPKCYVELRSS